MPCTQFQQEREINALPELFTRQFEQLVSEADLVKHLLGMRE